MIIWITGLSGAGKSTVAGHLLSQIKQRCKHAVLLDGDVIRQVWADQLGHDLLGRLKNAERVSRLCAYLDQQGIHVVAAILSISPEWRQWNRSNFSSYYEVFLDTPFEEVVKRDSKGLYKNALAGNLKNVVGVDIPMPTEETWDLKISAPEVLQAPQTISNIIYNHIKDKIF
ncbi:MAG: adenylyl-sulfate kinase [Alphaproteobacteria bacterium]|nr:adenylyl-sulfate kinase [Alphaproteobacteria bacterium]